ncbi:MAG: hypothetical protein RLZZ158_1938 [Cyanobacteriota bacterium]|jgi:hypothetical protein
MSSVDPRHKALLSSLRHRYLEAKRLGDAEAKQALFKEAVYLGIQPQEIEKGHGSPEKN